MWLACGACVACASAPAPSQDRIDAAFRVIQRSEAQFEGAARELEQIAASIAPGAGACVERCAALDHAAHAAREGAAGVCAAARDLESDHDARVRCERAGERGTAIEQSAGALRVRCGCGSSEAGR